MQGFFNKDCILKSKCNLSNIVSNIDDKTSLCIPKGFACFIYFRFQGKKFKLYDIEKSLKSEEDTEIFPGIYMRSTNRGNVLVRLMNIILQRKHFVIKNENRRDSFQICSEIEKTMLMSDYHSDEVIGTMMENVNPQNVEKPGHLGGGKCGGCAVHSYFNYLDILGEYDIDGYCFWGDEEAVEATKKEEFFLEMCRRSKCFYTYEKILKEGYDENIEMFDPIKVSYIDGKYHVGEGKHRVCAMRRFGYNKDIPMLVTRVGKSEGEPRELDRKYFSDNKHILESCYSLYERIGISSTDVKELLKNPYATVLDYLKRSKYTFEEILINVKSFMVPKKEIADNDYYLSI